MFTALSRRLAKALPPDGRRRVRAIIDPLLAPIGSIKRARRETRLVALTFDDGPDPLVTPGVLALLAARGWRASFFVLVERARDHPELVRAIADAGHEIGLHFDRHDRLTMLPLREVRRRMAAARDDLERLARMPIRIMRPPFGAQSLPTFAAARSLGLDVAVWGPTAEDWIEQSPEQAAARLLEHLRPGEIALLHDGLHVEPGDVRPTFDRVRMVELILDGIAARDLEATSVERLVAAAGARRTAWFKP